MLSGTFLSGLLSGTINKFLVHPIDTIKARIQINQIKYEQLGNIQQIGILNTAKKIYRQEGIRGFYQGVGIACLFGAPATCLFFGSYETLKLKLKSLHFTQSDMLINFLSGFGAECCSSVLWVPIDVIKERQQVQNELKIYHYRNSFDAIAQILKKESFVGFYRAYGATILAFGPFLGINLSLYEKLKQVFQVDSSKIKFHTALGMALITGVVAAVITNPFEVPKVRMQVQ